MKVRPYLRPWHGIAAAAVLAAVAVLISYYWYWQPPGAAMLAALAPPSTRVAVHIDVAALRRGGVLDMLAGARAIEDSEYARFVRQTQFDYKRDLEAVLLTFGAEENFYFASGRFSWKSIREYLAAGGGACEGHFCYTSASQPGRYLSLRLLSRNLLAMAVSADRRAVLRLAEPGGTRRGGKPPDPVWVELYPTAFQHPEAFPSGTQLFAKALQGSEGVTIGFDRDGARFRARLKASCAGESEAKILEAQFERITDVLRKMIAARGERPNPRDLSGVLTAGVFRREGRQVIGEWPIERPFLEALSGGDGQ